MYDVTRVAYQAITPLALFVHNEEQKHNSRAAVQHLYAPLDKFLSVIMDCLLFKEFNSDMLDPAAEALIALICARRVICIYIRTDS
jgi:Co/Zn/Cd efflux system component